MSVPRLTGFDVIEKLGTGGQATVWKARQVSLDRIVAIKILSAQLASDPSDIERFQAEARSAARLKHPGIVQVYDAQVEGGQYYFVMEYVAGYTVGDWLRRKGPLSEKDALLVAECVADALDYAVDQAGLIHCDIKPDNVIIDADGAVKVADLGLSRTINAMTQDGAAAEVMGTPAYISPEQAMGKPDLDFRADVYSLGAMLYHLVTAKLLFEGHPDERVVDLQVSETVPDPLDMDAKVSKPMCWLIEKMLCKRKEDRQASWKEDARDIARVKDGLTPSGRMPQAGSSTMQRSKRRTKADYVRGAKRRGAVSAARFWAAAGLVACVVGGVVFVRRMTAPEPEPVPPPRPPAPTVVTPPPDPVEPSAPVPVVNETEQNAREMFGFAKAWAGEHPDEYEEAIKRLRRVVSQTRGTKYSLMAEDLITELEKDFRRRMGEVLAGLEETAGPLLKKEYFDEAVSVYEGYGGPLAVETATRRDAIIEELRQQQARADEQRKRRAAAAAQQLEAALDAVAAELVASGVESALAVLKQATGQPLLANRAGELAEIATVLRAADRIDDRILATLKEQEGEEITVQLVGGPKKLKIVEVVAGRVEGEQSFGTAATVSMSFGVQDLSTGERLVRMGSDDVPEVALVKGLMACEAKAYPHAKRYFASAPPALAARLVRAVELSEQPGKDEEAEKALRAVLGGAGIDVGAFAAGTWGKAVETAELTAQQAKNLAGGLETFRKKYGSSVFARRCGPVLAAMEEAVAADRSSAGGARSELIPSMDSDKVITELLRRNPKLERDHVQVVAGPDGSAHTVEIRAPGDALGVIEPLAGLTYLRALICVAGGADRGRLRDLSALAKLRLEHVEIQNCWVQDLGPLSLMNLRSLVLARTNVRDLEALKGMSLSALDVSGTQVSDCSVLEGMPLRQLNISDTKVNDISFLRGSQIGSLHIENTGVTDLGPLKGLTLRELACRGIRANDFTALAGAPIIKLWIDHPERKRDLIDSLSYLRILNGEMLRVGAPGGRPWPRGDRGPGRRGPGE